MSMTTRSPLKQIPTCLWTTPKSLLVGGAVLVARGGSGLSEQCLWVWGEQHCLARGTRPHPGEPRHSGALTFGHSPTAPEQGGQSQVLVTQFITSPREQAGAAGNGIRGIWDMRLQCGSVQETSSMWHLKEWIPLSRWLLLSLVCPCLCTSRERA